MVLPLAGKPMKKRAVMPFSVISQAVRAYECEVAPGTLLSKCYGGATTVFERHRHRFEFNNAYRESFRNLGLVFGGRNPQNDLVESVELPDHPFYIGVQYHPEFKSRPHRPQPIFKAFVAAALNRKESRK